MKVLDFGLAKVFAGDPSGPDLTQSPTVTVGGTRGGAILGTAAYMSPEQARGQPVDKRTDIWAFGCVLYEMLTGRMAFPGQTVSDVIAAILEREPDWSALPDSTPPAIRKLLTRCFEKEHQTRLRDIGDARLELEDALNPTNVDDSWSRSPVHAKDCRSRGYWQRLSQRRREPLRLAAGRFRAPRRPERQRSRESVRLTSSAAREMAPAISPDGKWVAYLSDARGPTDVWVQFIGGSGQPNQSDGRRKHYTQHALGSRRSRDFAGWFENPVLGRIFGRTLPIPRTACRLRLEARRASSSEMHRVSGGRLTAGGLPMPSRVAQPVTPSGSRMGTAATRDSSCGPKETCTSTGRHGRPMVSTSTSIIP